MKVFHGRSLILNENSVYRQANPSCCGHPSPLCWWHSWAFPSTLCTSHPGAAEPIFAFRFCFFSFIHVSSNTVGEFVTPSSQAGAPPAPPQFLALGVSKCHFRDMIFLRWATAPKKGRNSKMLSCLALQGLSSGRCSPFEGSFTPKMSVQGWGFMERSQPCSKPVPEPPLALEPLVLGVMLSRVSGVWVCPEELIPLIHVGRRTWHEQLGYWGLFSPQAPPTVTGLVHEPEFPGKTQWLLGLSCAGRYDTVKIPKFSFGGNFCYGNSKNSQSGACSANLIDLAP